MDAMSLNKTLVMILREQTTHWISPHVRLRIMRIMEHLITGAFTDFVGLCDRTLK